MKKLVSITTPCFNEEENVRLLYESVKDIFSRLPQYEYQHLFIDNDSSDRTVGILREIASTDQHVKVIVNLRNYGGPCSIHHAMLSVGGDAVIPLVCDFQEPLEMIPRFLEKWEEGHPIVVGVKSKTQESLLMFLIRRFYYWLIGRISSTKQIPNYTGYGIYDRKVIDCLKLYIEPAPYFRGMIAELGFPIEKIEYLQPRRENGKSSFNFYGLYEVAMNGFVSSSILPLRLATFTGFSVAFFSLAVAFYYLVYKLLNWNTFNAGIAPLVIGLCFFSAVQLIFLGFLGEYVGAILTQVKNRPLVIEKERINFPETENNGERKAK